MTTIDYYRGSSNSSSSSTNGSHNSRRRRRIGGFGILPRQWQLFVIIVGLCCQLLVNVIWYRHLANQVSQQDDENMVMLRRLSSELDALFQEQEQGQEAAEDDDDDDFMIFFTIRDSLRVAPTQIPQGFHIFDYMDGTINNNNNNNNNTSNSSLSNSSSSSSSSSLSMGALEEPQQLQRIRGGLGKRGRRRQRRVAMFDNTQQQLQQGSHSIQELYYNAKYIEPAACSVYSVACYRHKIGQVFQYLLDETTTTTTVKNNKNKNNTNNVSYFFYMEMDNELCVSLQELRNLTRTHHPIYFLSVGIGFSGWIMSRQFVEDFMDVYAPVRQQTWLITSSLPLLPLSQNNNNNNNNTTTNTNDTTTLNTANGVTPQDNNPLKPHNNYTQDNLSQVQRFLQYKESVGLTEFKNNPDVVASFLLIEKQAWAVTRQYYVSHTILPSVGAGSLTVVESSKVNDENNNNNNNNNNNDANGNGNGNAEDGRLPHNKAALFSKLAEKFGGGGGGGGGGIGRHMRNKKESKHLPRCLEPRRAMWPNNAPKYNHDRNDTNDRPPPPPKEDMYGWDYFDYDLCPTSEIFPCGPNQLPAQVIFDNMTITRERAAAHGGGGRPGGVGVGGGMMTMLSRRFAAQVAGQGQPPQQGKGEEGNKEHVADPASMGNNNNNNEFKGLSAAQAILMKRKNQ